MEQYALPLFFVVIAASLIAYSISSLDLTGMFVKTPAQQNVSTTQTTETKTQEQTETQNVTTPTCPNCDDNNPCTKDSCDASTNYTCKYTKTTGPTEGCNEYITGTCSKKTCMSGKCVLISVLNCCGNNMCEEGENYSNCAKDCAQTTTSEQTASTQQTTQTQSTVNAANHVVISEILTKAPTCFIDGSDREAFEFIELYNPTSSSISVGEWWVVYYTSTRTSWNDYEWRKSLPSAATIAPYSYYLITVSKYWDNSSCIKPSWASGIISDFNLGYSAQGGKITFSKGTIALHTQSFGNILDALGWGDTSLYETSPIASPETGKSLERKPGSNNPNGGNWQDTDNNANDFVSRESPEPQNSVSATEIPS